MSQDPHRESCRRQHRVLSHYLAIQAWVRGLDCIVLVRDDLERFLGLKRFKSIRIEWLREDMKPWFPNQVAYYRTNAASSIHSLFLSRIPIEKHLPGGSMTTDQRISRMKAGAPSTARFSKTRSRSQIPDEKEIVAELAVLAAGLDQPSDLD